jgi:hypothetical protein
VKRRWKLALALDQNSPTQGKLGRGAQIRGLPATQEFFAAHQAQWFIAVVKKAILL